MAHAEIESGICGFTTQVTTCNLGNYQIEISIKSDCPDIKKLAGAVEQVNALKEISFRQGDPEIIQAEKTNCSHASCPVPIGILKAVEVEAGLALPENVRIRLRK